VFKSYFRSSHGLHVGSSEDRKLKSANMAVSNGTMFIPIFTKICELLPKILTSVIVSGDGRTERQMDGWKNGRMDRQTES
jgi:hypothetical protein